MRLQLQNAAAQSDRVDLTDQDARHDFQNTLSRLYVIVDVYVSWRGFIMFFVLNDCRYRNLSLLYNFSTLNSAAVVHLVSSFRSRVVVPSPSADSVSSDTQERGGASEGNGLHKLNRQDEDAFFQLLAAEIQSDHDPQARSPRSTPSSDAAAGASGVAGSVGASFAPTPSLGILRIPVLPAGSGSSAVADTVPSSSSAAGSTSSGAPAAAGVHNGNAVQAGLGPRSFQTSQEVPRLLDETAAIYARLFEEGDQAKAHTQLLATVSSPEYRPNEMFRLGVKIGVVVLLACWNLFALVYPAEGTAADARSPSVIPIYRCCGLLLVYVWFWGLNVFIWTRYRVNYVFVFEFAPQTRLRHTQIFDEAASLSVIYLINALLYNYSMFPWLSRVIYPASLLVFLGLKLFTPWEPFPLWRSRRVLLDSLYQIITSPFGRVRFLDIYVADV